MFGEEFAEGGDAFFVKDDAGGHVLVADEGHEFAAAAAGGEDLAFADGDDGIDPGFAVLEHFGDGGMLGAKADAAGDVDADAGVDFSGDAAHGGGDASGGEIAGEREFALDFPGGGEEFFESVIPHAMKLQNARRHYFTG